MLPRSKFAQLFRGATQRSRKLHLDDSYGIAIGTTLMISAVLFAPACAGAAEFLAETADGAPNADVGRYSSLARDPLGRAHIAYFDNTTKDLKYARRSATGWLVETADGSAEAVGFHCAIALDAQRNPHVSYYNLSTGNLMHARRSGRTWTRETIDASANDVGRYATIAIAGSGEIHVAYYDNTRGDLAYAVKASGAWTLGTIDASPTLAGLYASIEVDASGSPHVSYIDDSLDDLLYARRSAGAWIIETVDAGNAGFATSLALDALGNPHIAYYDFVADDLLYTTRSGGAWSIETADGAANDVGLYASIALGGGGVHVSYLDESAGDLLYARKSGGSWTRVVVDGGPTMTGSYSAIAVDGGGNPCMSYYDATGDDLRYAMPTVLQEKESTAGEIAGKVLGDEDDGAATAPAPSFGSMREAGLGLLPLVSATPNPSGGVTHVRYRVAADAAFIELAVYDASGRRVRDLASGAARAGEHAALWDGSGTSGERVPPGHYFLRLATPAGVVAERIVIVR